MAAPECPPPSSLTWVSIWVVFFSDLLIRELQKQKALAKQVSSLTYVYWRDTGGSALARGGADLELGEFSWSILQGLLLAAPSPTSKTLPDKPNMLHPWKRERSGSSLSSLPGRVFKHILLGGAYPSENTWRARKKCRMVITYLPAENRVSTVWLPFVTMVVKGRVRVVTCLDLGKF